MSVLSRNPSYDFQAASSTAGAGASDSQIGSCGLPRLGYSVAEAAQVTSISKSKLWELIKSGELGSVKISGRRIVRHRDLVALLDREAI